MTGSAEGEGVIERPILKSNDSIKRTERCVTDVYGVCMGDGRISAGILPFF